MGKGRICGLVRLNRRLVFRIVAFSAAIFFGLQIYTWSSQEYGNPWSINYFLDEKAAGAMEYVIDTPKCKILKLSPWDEAILPFIKPKISPPDCSKRNRHWSYVRSSFLHLNRTSIEESGYSLNSLRCCYKVILRVEQTLSKNDFRADNEVRYSDECHKMEERTHMKDQFVRVFCTATSWPFMGEVVYREFHALAIPSSTFSKNKIRRWKDNEGLPLPPSVVMIGIDSLSRMNFHRSFNHTRRVLEQLGAVEMLGYTKVGENTHPNTVAFLTGYTHSELLETCLKTADLPQDFCPYVWKNFSAAGYLTATVEDAPGLVGFNYLRLGFVERPTDFYFRPFMLAVHKSLPRMDYYHTDCIGHLTTEETLLNYIGGIMNHSSTAPVFIHSWMTSLAHLDINGARFADAKVAAFLQSQDLSNTILIFMSDHGQRYGAIRETLAGWYEDKLPILSIYIPPSVRHKFPSWKESLIFNSKRLSSPFDLYKTIEHVLKEYSEDNSKAPLSEEKTPKQRIGQSLFAPISSQRSCEDAGIRINYCACLPPRRLDMTDPKLLEAAKTAVAYLNDAVPGQCAMSNLDRVVAGALMESLDETTYVVTFYTTPGDFLFEANVEYYEGAKFRVTTDLLRMNKISRSAECVDTSLLERYCYCL